MYFSASMPKRPTTRMPTAQAIPATAKADLARRRAMLRTIMRAEDGR